MKQRSIAIAIILTIVTCGIYGLYWMVQLNNDINTLAEEDNATSGGKVILLSIITCGIYSIYWNFKMGERVDRIKGSDGSSHILYLILCIIGLGIVNFALMQDTINKNLEA